MPHKRHGRRNPNGFTTDEAQTATLMVAEGSYSCHRHGIYAYPRLDIPMCDREALEPAERVFRTKITAKRTKVIRCRPEDFPPDGKGTWRIGAAGGHLEAVVQRL